MYICKHIHNALLAPVINNCWSFPSPPRQIKCKKTKSPTRFINQLFPRSKALCWICNEFLIFIAQQLLMLFACSLKLDGKSSYKLVHLSSTCSASRGGMECRKLLSNNAFSAEMATQTFQVHTLCRAASEEKYVNVSML